jgi:uncharacterized membrane protein
MAKSAVFGVMHIAIAFGVSYWLTGSVAIAGAITLVEPLANTVAHYFFDRLWGHPALVRHWQAWRRGRSARSETAHVATSTVPP